MRAKEKISTALQASIFTAEQAEHLTQELYDAVAHELAEKIRAEAKEWDGWPEKQASMIFSADFIDPEVSP